MKEISYTALVDEYILQNMKKYLKARNHNKFNQNQSIAHSYSNYLYVSRLKIMHNAVTCMGKYRPGFDR
jgi:hypothetical protein